MAATYTVKQVAEILGYSTNSIYSFLKEKRIKGIRVGTGRFRIPQSELNRLLLQSKEQKGIETGTGNIVPLAGTIISPDTDIIPPHERRSVFSLSLFGRTHSVSANIFDWFLGISTVVGGIALYLFNQAFDVVHTGWDTPLMPVVRILLIGGGAGVLLTNFTFATHTTWYKIFRGLLLIAGCVLTIFMLNTRDIDAMAIYGTLTILVTLTMFVRLGRVIPFALYLTLLAISAPVVVFLAPEDLHVLALINVFHVSSAVLGVGLSFVCFGFILLFWLGMYRKKALFWITTYIAAAVYFALAFWFAHGQFWSRSFFFMIIALTCMYLPSWEDLVESRNKRAHLLALGVFAAIMAVIITGVAVVHLTQLNVIATVERENVQKVDYARTLLETDIQSVKSIVTTASINPDLIAGVTTKDTTVLTDLSRIMFDSSNSIQRIDLLDKNGSTVFLYPLGTDSVSNLSFRDYFIQARDTGHLYVSDMTEALTDRSQKKVVTVSAPILTAQKEFVGVLAVSLDLDAISSRLQKIAVVDRGEYIVVLDSHGKRIMHPVQSLIGTDTEPTDPTLLALQGKTGIGEGDTYDGIHSLIAYTPVESLHWAMALKAPYNNIFALSATANLVVAGLVIGCVMIAVLVFQLNYIYKYKPSNGGGSP